MQQSIIIILLRSPAAVKGQLLESTATLVIYKSKKQNNTHTKITALNRW